MSLSPDNCPMWGLLSDPPLETAVTAPTASDIEELQARNLIHSPLLRLPYEMVVHILLFIMGNEEPTPTWTPVLLTCHHLCQLILSTPTLWSRIYCTNAENIFKQFEMAAWSPTEIYVNTRFSRNEENIGVVLDRVRGSHLLYRHRIHTLNFQGSADTWSHFSWIFDQPLPNLQHLSMDPAFAIPLTDSTRTNLETLSIDVVEIPASLGFFHNLRNLHVRFSVSDRPQTSCQLFAFLNSSPRLETLSYVRLRSPPRGGDQRRGVATLSHLSSLTLEAPASEVAFILNHLNLPAIDFLSLKPPNWESSDIPLFFQNDILVNRLFKDTQIFPHLPGMGFTVRMTGFELEGNMTSDWKNIIPVMGEMASLSLTELELTRDTMDEGYWSRFARRRPEVRSIVSSYGAKNYCLSKGLWRALLPDRSRSPTVLFPKLESVTLKAQHLSMIPPMALRCLRARSEAGFKLKHLVVQDSGIIPHIGRQPEEFRSLTDVFVYCEAPKEL